VDKINWIFCFVYFAIITWIMLFTD